MPLQTLKQAMLQDNRDAFHRLPAQHWPKICSQMIVEPPSGDLSAVFRSWWAQYGEHIRAHTEDDALVARALRAWLPAYQGPGMTLFRGESAGRYEAQRLGFNWTPKQSVAEMFGSGWNALHPGGGRLLRCDVPASAIISAPDSHSRWLGENEYVVEPAMLEGVVVIAEYPQK